MVGSYRYKPQRQSFERHGTIGLIPNPLGNCIDDWGPTILLNIPQDRPATWMMPGTIVHAMV